MTRRFGLFLLTLPAVVGGPALPALAQTYQSPPPGYYQVPPPPGAYVADDPDTVVVRPRRGPLRSLFGGRDTYVAPYEQAERDDSGTLPPPGFTPPRGGSGYGYPSMAQSDTDVVRPPAAVGAQPQPQPPAITGNVPPVAAQPHATPNTVMQLPPEDQPEVGKPKELPENLKKQLVDYSTKEPAGTIIVDTANTYLFLVLGQGKAMRYGIGVGREGFTWTGTERVSRMKEWPDWFPPAEMIERQPYLPRMMAGGPGNPLGARALYLGKTLYRIHGTNQPSTIGSYVSSGCIRLLNEDIEDLYSRVQTGTRVVVLPGKAPETVANAQMPPGIPGAANAAPAPGAPVSIAPPSVGSSPVISSQPLPPVR